MDNCDCWISEPDARFFLNSPGPSSGYCSAEESLHSKYNTAATASGGDSSSSTSRLRGQRDLDSPWRGQSPSLVLSSTTNPCLSGDGGTAGGGMMKVDSLPDLKNSLSFDDLMDTLYDPFGDAPRMSDYPGCESIGDIEMIDTDCTMFFGRGGSNQSFTSMSSGSSESSLINLLKTPDRTGMSGNQTSGRFDACQVQTPPPPQLGAGLRASKYVTVPVRSSLAMDQQRSNSVVNVSRSSGLCSTVSSLHQHMADMNDMSAAAGDASDYVLRLMPNANEQQPVAKPVEAVAKNPISVPTQNSARLGGVFSQRGSISTLRSCEPKALGRIKGGAVATSCGTFLRHSVSIPNSMNTAPVQVSATKENGKPILDPKTKNGLISSTKPNNCDRAMTSGDMRGGRATSAYPALDDHRYTLKQVPPNQNVSKLRKSNGTHSSNPSFSGKEGPVRMTGGATSILEAFLRSTRPMDPNKGSNAALAAEGLSYLRLDEKQAKEKPDLPGPGGNGGNASGMLLKKLLTGEIDQGQVLQRQRGGDHHDEQLMVHGSLLCPTLPIDSPLTDGFGLDVDLSLDDSQIMGMGLMGPDMPDMNESIWLGDLADELAVSELDEILREQTRQEDLWVEHYVNNRV